MRLEGKTAFITGGSEGIGKATALLFCQEGATVGIMARTKENLDKVVLEAEGPGEIISYKADVSKSDEVEQAVNDFYGRYGKIDILFNNAGILEGGTVVTTTDDVWESILQVSL